MFRNMKELVYDATLNDEDPYVFAKAEAVELCKNFKGIYNLTDEQIPFKIFWNEKDSHNPKYKLLSCDVKETDEEQLNQYQQIGVGILTTLMWLFDIKREELIGSSEKVLMRLKK